MLAIIKNLVLAMNQKKKLSTSMVHNKKKYHGYIYVHDPVTPQLSQFSFSLILQFLSILMHKQQIAISHPFI